MDDADLDDQGKEDNEEKDISILTSADPQTDRIHTNDHAYASTRSSCAPKLNTAVQENSTSPGKKSYRRNINEKMFKLLESRENDRKKVMDELRRSRTEQRVCNTQEDDTDVFFRSMAMTVKKFSPLYLADAKKKICSLVMDLQFENENFIATSSLRLPEPQQGSSTSTDDISSNEL